MHKKTNRAEEIARLRDQLDQQVAALVESDQWRAWLRLLADGFHTYSLRNTLLILSQFPEATQVAGYRAWQDKGRQVRKGERGIRILRPGTGKRTETADDGTEEEHRFVYFVPTSVFDISQTDPMPGQPDATDIAPHLHGEDPLGLRDQVFAMLTARGVTCELETIAGDSNGYSHRQDDGTIRVVVDDTLTPAHQAKTALHEAAHVMLGHLDDPYGPYQAHRGRYEVEAESVAFIVAGLHDLDTSTYSTGYVAIWGSDATTDDIEATAATIIDGARAIAEALDTAGDLTPA